MMQRTKSRTACQSQWDCRAAIAPRNDKELIFVVASIVSSRDCINDAGNGEALSRHTNAAAPHNDKKFFLVFASEAKH
jgi:hypothetical protein